MKIFERKWNKFPKDRTPFERFLRHFMFVPAPKAMTCMSWARHELLLKKRFPIRWFFWETIPEAYRVCLGRPVNKVRRWFRYRFIDRYDVIKLEENDGYLDPDERMLRFSFQILKDFIEIELASMYRAFQPKEDQSGPTPLKFVGRAIRRSRRKKHRDPESGLAHLEWEITETSGQQALAAKEKKDLYLWWTKERPHRLEVYSDPHVLQFKAAGDKRYYQLIANLEQFYEAQDEEMLVRLMKVRKSLWT